MPDLLSKYLSSQTIGQVSRACYVHRLKNSQTGSFGVAVLSSFYFFPLLAYDKPQREQSCTFTYPSSSLTGFTIHLTKNSCVTSSPFFQGVILPYSSFLLDPPEAPLTKVICGNSMFLTILFMTIEAFIILLFKVTSTLLDVCYSSTSLLSTKICFPRLYISVLRLLITKHHKLGGLKQQKFIVSQFWLLDSPDQGASRSVFPLRSFLASSSWKLILGNLCLIDKLLQSVPPSSRGLLPCVFVSLFFLKDTSPIGFRVHLTPV